MLELQHIVKSNEEEPSISALVRFCVHAAFLLCIIVIKSNNYTLIYNARTFHEKNCISLKLPGTGWC